MDSSGSLMDSIGALMDSIGALSQKLVIIRRGERGYGFTVCGGNPAFVVSVKQDGAAARAGVQNGDRIVKVNGTLVTHRIHLDVAKLIEGRSYIALTLLRETSASATSGGIVTNPSTSPFSRDSGFGRVTAPQLMDADKDRELWQQKLHMTRAMYETAREDFEKVHKQIVSKLSVKLLSQLVEKEKTAKDLENQLKQLTGEEEPVLKFRSALVTRSVPHAQTTKTVHVETNSTHSEHSGTGILVSASSESHSDITTSQTFINDQQQDASNFEYLAPCTSDILKSISTLIGVSTQQSFSGLPRYTSDKADCCTDVTSELQNRSPEPKICGPITFNFITNHYHQKSIQISHADLVAAGGSVKVVHKVNADSDSDTEEEYNIYDSVEENNEERRRVQLLNLARVEELETSYNLIPSLLTSNTFILSILMKALSGEGKTWVLASIITALNLCNWL